MYRHGSAENDPPRRWLREQIKTVVGESIAVVAERESRKPEAGRTGGQMRG
jgi:hypothetical protein